MIHEKELSHLEHYNHTVTTVADIRRMVATIRVLRQALVIAWEDAYSLSARQKDFILQVLEDTK